MLFPNIANAAMTDEDGLERASPDQAGVDPRAVLDFIDNVFAENLDLHSFMLYRHGKVVSEGWSWPYERRRPHMMHSLTKSVTACGVGLAIEEGHFSLHDPVISFFDEELPATIDSKLEKMTVRDLLTMQSGHAVSVSGSVFRQVETSWVAEFFKIPVVYDPGTHFVYSSALSFMLSAILTKTTGKSLHDYLKPRVLEPLGITDVKWGASPNGITSGGNGLSWTTSDSLKLAILHLNMGQWNGRQIIPKRWVEEATRTQVPGEQYGYHWWQNESGNAYLADGAFGQFSIVFPEFDAALAITAGVNDDALIDLVWKYFPAAFDSKRAAIGKTANAELRDRTENLRLLPEALSTTSPMAQKVSGRTYSMEPNDDDVSSVKLAFSAEHVVFSLSDSRGEHQVKVGLSEWIESTTSMTGNKLHHQYQSDDMRVVAHGRWWDERTFEMTWQFVETAWVDHVTVRFWEDRISLDRRVNANYAPRVRPTLRGRRS
jgi:CubicO group peptidase (beta-lactamase class C family)